MIHIVNNYKIFEPQTPQPYFNILALTKELCTSLSTFGTIYTDKEIERFIEKQLPEFYRSEVCLYAGNYFFAHDKFALAEKLYRYAHNMGNASATNNLGLIQLCFYNNHILAETFFEQSKLEIGRQNIQANKLNKHSIF